jgi:hypothetical protein
MVERERDQLDGTSIRLVWFIARTQSCFVPCSIVRSQLLQTCLYHGCQMGKETTGATGSEEQLLLEIGRSRR